jgi:hypothetical protein
MPRWFNQDGLLVKLGVDEAVSNVGGEYDFSGNVHYSEYDIIGTSITNTLSILSDNTPIPRGARIQSVSLYVETAFTSSGAATLDIGLINGSDRTTTVAATGLVAGATVASLSLGANITGAGASVNTNVATTPGVLLGIRWNTAAFTAGRGKLRVNWYMP